MEARKTLRRPRDWENFEDLCKMLWGELWKCPEIKKVGRKGQQQNGVDLCGVPVGEKYYIGIQCKGKEEYLDKQFTKAEIIEEIEKAKFFKPALKKLYLATTALKDAQIEEFVREKDIDNRKNELFEVHIYSWEDIVDLIDLTHHTRKWYEKNQSYVIHQTISVTLDNGDKEMKSEPKFKEITTYYKVDDKSYMYASPRIYGFNSNELTDTINQSYIAIKIVIANVGTDPIENYKIFLDFEGEIEGIAKTNKKVGAIIPLNLRQASTVFLNKEKLACEIIPTETVLVGGDFYICQAVFIKPKPKESQIVINWKLVSRDFRDNGKLSIEVIPQFEKLSFTKHVDGSSKLKQEHTEIYDFIEKIDKH